MKKILILGLILPMFASCEQKNKQKESTENAVVSETIEVPLGYDDHNAQNSLDYFGSYEGALPCADCEGIKMTVTLNEDETFAVHSAYIKEGKEISASDYTGKFVWDKSGSIITLENKKEEPLKFFVGEGQIFLLDKDGNRVEGELSQHYILKKK